MDDNDTGLHSSDLMAMTDAALDALMPQWRDLPPFLCQCVKDGLMIRIHNAYSNSKYAREALSDD